MTTLLFVVLVVLVVAILIVVALYNSSNVKANLKLPFVAFSFEARQSHRIKPKAYKNHSS